MKKYKKIIIEVFILLFIVLGFVIVNVIMNHTRSTSFRFGNDGNGCVYQIEELNILEKEVVIKGWFFEPRKVRNKEVFTNEGKELGILLYADEVEAIDNTLDYKGIPLDVEYQRREDVNKYFSCEYNYSDCGFTARIDKSKLDLDNTTYQIIFKPDKYGKNGIASTDFISNKKLSHVRPYDSWDMDVLGTELEPIVKDGICLVSCKEYKTKVFQYDSKLYWIIDTKCISNDRDNTNIQCMVETTQFEKLPSERSEKGIYWDDIGFSYVNNDSILDLNIKDYKVVVKDIPKEYAITVLYTGMIDDEWLWQRKFRPVYKFE